MEKKEKKPNFFVRAGKAIGRYFKEVVGEVKKLSWPTKKELINYSLIVIGALVFFGVFVAVIDNIVLIPLEALASLGK